MSSFHTLLALITVLAGSMVAGLGAEEKSPLVENKQLVLNLNIEQSAKLISTNKEVVILDVRTPKEFAEGHLAGAKNLDFHSPDFKAALSKLDKEKTYLVHCATGRRSANTRELMKDLKFKSIYHMDGGIRAWEKAGKAVQK